MSEVNGVMPRVIRRVYSGRRLPIALCLISRVTVALTVLTFIAALVILALRDPLLSLGFALICGVPFLIVSFLRKRFNAPRPAEVYGLSFDGFLGKNKKGCSFPSRHVFSAFVIGTALCFYFPSVGIILCVLGACLGACRVLLGIHFIRDVVAGALFGIVSGIIGHLIVNIGLLSIFK